MQRKSCYSIYSLIFFNISAGCYLYWPPNIYSMCCENLSSTKDVMLAWKELITQYVNDCGTARDWVQCLRLDSPCRSCVGVSSIQRPACLHKVAFGGYLMFCTTAPPAWLGGCSPTTQSWLEPRFEGPLSDVQTNVRNATFPLVQSETNPSLLQESHEVGGAVFAIFVK